MQWRGSGPRQFNVLHVDPASSASTAASARLRSDRCTSPPGISLPQSMTPGNMLTEYHGVWSNTPTSYTYQWERCDTSGMNCALISGATSESYTLTAADLQHTPRRAWRPRQTRRAQGRHPSHPSRCLWVSPHRRRRSRLVRQPSGPLRAQQPNRRRSRRASGTSRPPRLEQAVAKTAGQSRHSSIRISLTPALQAYVGQTCARPLIGTGVVISERAPHRGRSCCPKASAGPCERSRSAPRPTWPAQR